MKILEKVSNGNVVARYIHSFKDISIPAQMIIPVNTCMLYWLGPKQLNNK